MSILRKIQSEGRLPNNLRFIISPRGHNGLNCHLFPLQLLLLFPNNRLRCHPRLPRLHPVCFGTGIKGNPTASEINFVEAQWISAHQQDLYPQVLDYPSSRTHFVLIRQRTYSRERTH